MLTVAAIGVMYAGFWSLYHTSKKIILRRSVILTTIQKKPRLVKNIGWCLLLVSFYLFTMEYGMGSGSLFASIFLMSISSLFILFYPLKNKKCIKP
ncbi:MAG: hypothetical protein RIG77_23810 [Cyclobacteriaceae bacterium]